MQYYGVLRFFELLRRTCAKSAWVVPGIGSGMLVHGAVDLDVDNVKRKKILVVNQFYFVCVFDLCEHKLRGYV
jgi:hypothetical protein